MGEARVRRLEVGEVVEGAVGREMWIGDSRKEGRKAYPIPVICAGRIKLYYVE